MIARYVRPGVEIQQVFLSANPTLVAPDLPTVVVGPNYQIVEGGEGAAYAGAELALAYPDLEAGAIILEDEVGVKLSAVINKVMGQADLTCDVADDALTIEPGENDPTFEATGVAVGDRIAITKDNATYSVKVKAVVDATTLTIDKDLDLAGAAFLITRPHAAFYIPVDSLTVTADDVTIAADLMVDDLSVYSATATVDYRALRTGTANKLTTVNRASDITAKLGKIDELNPLALGASFAKANTVSSVLAMGIEGTDAADWLTALGFLQNEDVYTVVLLTQDSAVQSQVKAHVDGMSVPEKSRFRIGFINLAHPRESVAAEPLTQASLVRAGGVVSVSHAQANFSGNVLAGDYVIVTKRTAAPATADPTLEGAYMVSSVKNDSTLVVESKQYTGSNGTYSFVKNLTQDFAANSVDIKVVRVLDKDGQAMAIARTADSYGDRRIFYITNHECAATVGGQDLVLPGYYLCAGFGGMNAGNPPHQGFTNLGLLGFKKVHYGSKYFNEDQCQLIAGSGGWLVMQETDEGLPFAYLQTSTDNSTIQRRELSITKTLDYYSKGLKAVVGRFIGPYNIVDETLTALHNGIEGFHQGLKSTRYDKIGAVLLSAEIVEIKQDDLESDTTRITTQVDIPTPFNRAKVRVEVQS